MLEYFYITNDPQIAVIAQNAGVERIFIDMEYRGKDKRQAGLDTVKNHHTVEDVKAVRSVIKNAQIMVRINPLFSGSNDEIDSVIAAGADSVMLPMWETAEDVEKFISIVGGRAKTVLLLETDSAAQNIAQAVRVNGIDEIHIGLNDLHLSRRKQFMFELYTDGTVDSIVNILKQAGIKYGIGGIGCVGRDNLLSAKNILCEHYRLGSSMVILSRAFCNVNEYASIDEFEKAFTLSVRQNREYERYIMEQDKDFLLQKHKQTAKTIEQIVG